MPYFAAMLAAAALLGGGAYAGLILSKIRRQRMVYPDPATLVIEPDVAVRVTRLEDDRLEIRWQADSGPVRIYAGTQPDAIDHTQPIAVGDERDHVVLAGLEAHQRYYFEVEFGQPQRHRLIVSERILPLASAANFRDIGGYRTSAGKHTRWGLLYRSGSLGQLSGDDEAYVAHLGLRTICDVRSAEEVREEPDRLPSNQPLHLHQPIFAGDNTRERLQALVFTPGKLHGMMLEAYTAHILENNTDFFKDFFERISQPANLPLLIHCTAGKDRTGVTIALLLLLLGVPEETVIADYSLSNHYYPHFHNIMVPVVQRIAWMGVSADDLKPLLTAHPDTMRGTLAYLKSRYGSAEAYLRSKVGLDDRVIAQLKAQFLW
jgi:protein-tyrosine phosphatase